jgi:hypothetical protein
MSAVKTFSVALVALCLAALAAVAQDSHHHAAPTQNKETNADDAAVVRRGEPIAADTQRVAFADVLKEPKKFAGKSVVVEGSVERVCQAEGCWMQITPDAGSEAGAVRVTFDHKFAVPKDSTKMKFRAEGAFSVKTLSKETVEHLIKEDGAKIKANPDGTADELAFLATGVELWK